MRSVVFLAFLSLVSCAIGGAYDDVIWSMRPVDLNGDGVAQAG